jgi:hypothetical protein
MDVIHKDGEIPMISVADWLNLVLQCKVENESQNALGMGLQGPSVSIAHAKLKSINSL